MPSAPPLFPTLSHSFPLFPTLSHSFQGSFRDPSTLSLLSHSFPLFSRDPSLQILLSRQPPKTPESRVPFPALRAGGGLPALEEVVAAPEVGLPGLCGGQAGLRTSGSEEGRRSPPCPVSQQGVKPSPLPRETHLSIAKKHGKYRVWVKIKPPGNGPQVLVHFFIYQDDPFWGCPIFDPQPGIMQSK